MKQQRGFSGRRPVVQAVSITVVVAITLGLAGCGNQMAKIDENQNQLEMMVKANSLQIDDIAGLIEKNQKELHVLVANVQSNVDKVAADVAAVAADVTAVADAQMKLYDSIKSSSQMVAGKIDTLGRNQQELTAGLGRTISGVQSETRNIAADLATVTADQAKLFEKMRLSSLELTEKLAAIEQAQQEGQNTIGNVQGHIKTVAAGISTLGEDVLRLQENLQSNISELVSMADISGQRQSEFQQSMSANLQTLEKSLTSLKASQSQLQSRIEASQNGQNELRKIIEQIQSQPPNLGDMPAALDQLKEQLEELSRSRMSDNNSNAIEYETSAEVSLETDSIE